jgi:glycosyltransferase involved in cell wall biosynthesis
VVAYHAESTIDRVLTRIPAAIAEQYDTEVLVIDDASTDLTFERASSSRLAFPLTVLSNPVNQGYGGNQKLGYLYALKYGFDFVALLHGDGQYAPECLPDLVRPLREGFITRFALLLGQFNYGRRGILDVTHTRLFTFASLRRLFDQGGFRVVEVCGVPGPYPLALGDGMMSRLLVRLNDLWIRLSKGLFSYQIFMVVQPCPSTDYLLQSAQEHTAARAACG